MVITMCCAQQFDAIFIIVVDRRQRWRTCCHGDAEKVRSSWTEQVRAAADLRQAPNSLTLVLRSSRVCTPLPLLFSFASVVLCGKTTQGNKATGDCLTRVLGGESLFSF